jgi:hypothetical protein
MWQSPPVRNLAPPGYIELQLAIGFMSRRMFVEHIPKHLLEAAIANVAAAADPTASKRPIKVATQAPGTLAGSLLVLINAFEAAELTLSIWTDDSPIIRKIPSAVSRAVLRATNFPPSRTTMYLRFIDMYPIGILDDIDLGLKLPPSAQKFRLCLDEVQFDRWLGRAARQYSWPLDSKPRSRGRPDRKHIVKPLIETIVESGGWRPGTPLKSLVSLVNSKLSGQSADRETVKRALALHYAETRDIRYRYRPRKRRGARK